MTYKIIGINFLEKSPFTSAILDFGKETILETNDFGIYGMRIDMLELGFDYFLRYLMWCAPNLDSLRFLLMEIEKCDITYQNVFEVAFSKGKVLKEFNLKQLIEFTKIALPNMRKNLLSIISAYNKSNDIANFTPSKWFDTFWGLEYEMIENLRKHGFDTKWLKKFVDGEAG
ncbi:MAG: hypothetical protein LBG19_10550 [Prevotellaceae bacterium]|jgi:hypothetical protein|nr:hypothetical protein [Prevotellaceae bacterium]